MTRAALEALLAAGCSYSEAGAAFGLGKDCVFYWAKRWGVRSRKPAHHPGTHRIWFRGRLLTLHEIAREIGAHYKTLWRRYQAGNRGEQLVRPARKKRQVPSVYQLGISLAAWREYADLARAVGLKTAANRTGLPYGALAAAVRGEWERLE